MISGMVLGSTTASGSTMRTIIGDGAEIIQTVLPAASTITETIQFPINMKNMERVEDMDMRAAVVDIGSRACKTAYVISGLEVSS